jgi:hypothetical protein
MAYKTNIKIQPTSKNKIIGDTSKFFLYGTVLEVGSEVSKEIEVGDTIKYTQWGTNKVVNADGTEDFYIVDDSQFILDVVKKNDTKK